MQLNKLSHVSWVNGSEWCFRFEIRRSDNLILTVMGGHLSVNRCKCAPGHFPVLCKHESLSWRCAEILFGWLKHVKHQLWKYLVKVIGPIFHFIESSDLIRHSNSTVFSLQRLLFCNLGQGKIPPMKNILPSAFRTLRIIRCENSLKCPVVFFTGHLDVH